MIFPRGRIPSEEKEYLANFEVQRRAEFGSLVSVSSVLVETLFNKLMEPVAAVGAAEGKPNAVFGQLEAAAGEDWRPFGKVCPLLLAIAGREPSHAAPVWKHA